MLNHLATFHKQNIVGDAAEKSHRVRDDDHRVTTVYERTKQRAEAVDTARIERACWFIE